MIATSDKSPGSAADQDQDDSVSRLDSFATRTRNKLLLVGNQVGTNLGSVRLYFYTFQVLSTFQLLYFSVGVLSRHSWNLSLWLYLVTALRSTTLQVQENLFTQDTLTVLLLVSLGFVLFWVLSFVGVLLWGIDQSKNLSGPVRWYIRLFTLVSIPLEGLLMVIFSQMFHLSLSCNFSQTSKTFSNSYCVNSAKSKINLSLASLLLICAVAWGLLFKRLRLAINPLSVSPSACFAPTRGLYLMLLKILLPLYEIAADPNTPALGYRILLTLVHMGTFFLRVRCPIEPHRAAAMINSLSDLTQVLVAGTMILESLGSRSNLELLYFPVALFTAVFALQRLEKLRTIATLRVNLFELETTEEVDRFVYSFVVLVDRASAEEEFRDSVWFALKSTSDHLHKKILTTRPVPSQLLTAAAHLKSLLTEQSKPQVFKTQLFQLADALIDWVICTNKIEASAGKTDFCRMIRASILSSRLENPWEAIHQVEKIQQEGKPSWGVLLGLTRMLKQVEHGLVEAELRDHQNTGVNIIKLVQLEQAVAELYRLVETNTDHMIRFWEELLSESLNGEVLRRIGFKVTSQQTRVKAKVDQILSDHPNQLQTLMLYGQYLDSVLNEQEEASKYLSKAATVHHSVKSNSLGAASPVEDSRSRLYSQLNPCILVVSANRHNMGTIKSANAECNKVLGWAPEELVGRKVETIMPKVYAAHHDKWMHKFFSGQGSGFVNTPRMLFALAKSGFLVEITLLLKFDPYLNSGLNLIGSISLGEPSSAILLHQEQLVGVTEEAFRLFGIHPSLVKLPGSFSVLGLFSNIHEIKQLEDQIASNMPMVIDTRLLLEAKYFPEQEENQTYANQVIPRSEAFGCHRVKFNILERHFQPSDIRKLSIYEIKEVFTAQKGNSSQGSLNDELSLTPSKHGEISNLSNAFGQAVEGPKGFSTYLDKARFEIPTIEPTSPLIIADFTDKKSQSKVDFVVLKADRTRKSSKSIHNSRSTESKSKGAMRRESKVRFQHLLDQEIDEEVEAEIQKADLERKLKEQRSSMRKREWNSSILMFMALTFIYLLLLYSMQIIVFNYQTVRRTILANKLKSTHFDYIREYLIVRSFPVGQGLFITALLPAALQISPKSPPANILTAPYNTTIAAVANRGQITLMSTIINILQLQDEIYTQCLQYIKSYEPLSFPNWDFIRADLNQKTTQSLSTTELPYIIINRAESFIDTVTRQFSLQTVGDVTNSFLRFMAQNLFPTLAMALQSDRSSLQEAYRAKASQLSWTNIMLLASATLTLNIFCIWVYFEYYPLFKKCIACVHVFGEIQPNDVRTSLEEILRFKGTHMHLRSSKSLGYKYSTAATKTAEFHESSLESDEEDLDSLDWREKELRKRLGVKPKSYLPVQTVPSADFKLLEATRRHADGNKPKFPVSTKKISSQGKPLEKFVLASSGTQKPLKTQAKPDHEKVKSKEPQFAKRVLQKETDIQLLANAGVVKPGGVLNPEEEEQSSDSARRDTFRKSLTTSGFIRQLTERTLIAFVVVAPVLTFSLYWDAVAVSRLDQVYRFQENVLQHLQLIQYIEASAQSLLMIGTTFQIMGVIDPNTCLKVLKESIDRIIQLDSEMIQIGANLPQDVGPSYQFYTQIQDFPVCNDETLSILNSTGFNTSTIETSCKSLKSEQGATRMLRELFNFIDSVVILYKSTQNSLQNAALTVTQTEQLKYGLFASGYQLSGQLRTYNTILGGLYSGFGLYFLQQSKSFFQGVFLYDLGIAIILAIAVTFVWIVCCCLYYSGLQRECWTYMKLLTLLPERILANNIPIQKQIADILDRF